MSVKSQAVMQTATEKPDIHAEFLDQLVTPWKGGFKGNSLFEIILMERFACTDVLW